MKNQIPMLVTRHNRRRQCNQRGLATVEFAIIAPLMIITFLVIVDFARVFDARFVITNLAREGGSLGSRDLKSATELITLLQTGASPLDLQTDGTVCISKISAGTNSTKPKPSIPQQTCVGALGKTSSIKVISGNLVGLSPTMTGYLTFKSSSEPAKISGVTVVEVYFKYRPITPLSKFIPGLLTSDGGGIIINSKAVFLSTQ